MTVTEQTIAKLKEECEQEVATALGFRVVRNDIRGTDAELLWEALVVYRMVERRLRAKLRMVAEVLKLVQLGRTSGRISDLLAEIERE